MKRPVQPTKDHDSEANTITVVHIVKTPTRFDENTRYLEQIFRKIEWPYLNNGGCLDAILCGDACMYIITYLSVSLQPQP